tara:strand:+ start:5127 stop:5357 length:231 start_codon:yes stop_codon:yes gene_type:complete
MCSPFIKRDSQVSQTVLFICHSLSKILSLNLYFSKNNSIVEQRENSKRIPLIFLLYCYLLLKMGIRPIPDLGVRVI